MAQIGIYGLGTMGSALALNFAEKGIRVAVSNREAEWIPPFLKEAGPLASQINAAQTLPDLVAALERPRALLLMIPSGAPVDAMLQQLDPLLEPGDMVIDAGNANFHDTIRRSALLSGRGLHFIGMGVSGGEIGARFGPSMMVGGTAESWTRLRPLLEPIAARFNGDPCAAHMGPDGAGHFVKTVHNGIEYADMQMIAEVYGLLRDGVCQDPAQIAAVFGRWRDGPLASYLIDVTARALTATDPATGAPMVDVILDQAGQKGTGRWTVIEALHLGESANTIEAAVGARAWSADRTARGIGAQTLSGPDPAMSLPEGDLEQALWAGRVLSHAQGFRILSAASDAYSWSLDLARICEIWRAGCIIRSVLLDDLGATLRGPLPEGHILLAPDMVARLAQPVAALRRVVGAALAAGLPVPALAGALIWYDSLRQARGTADLIQAQRDFFGAHGFLRTDQPGTHHGHWPPFGKNASI